MGDLVEPEAFVAQGGAPIVTDEHRGVRWYTPSRAEPGEVTAVLAFRVGILDEPLPLRGASHLVEHLALAAVRDRAPSTFNGSVGLSRTMFSVQGAAEEVSDFLTALSRSLHDLPPDRSEHERRVLQTEAQAHSSALVETYLGMRFGVGGPGRAALPEWGLEWLEHPDLTAWASTWFTAANAVLWSTAPLPDLDLDLPTGAHRPVASLGDRTLIDLPAGLVAGHGRTTLCATVGRSPEVVAFARLAERRLEQRLRHDDGVSYAVSTLYDPIDVDRANLVIDADAHAAYTEEAAAAFVRTITDLVEAGPTTEELDEHRRWSLEARRREPLTSRLHRVSLAHLDGDPDPIGSALPDGLAEPTSDAVRRAGDHVRANALLFLPTDLPPTARQPFGEYVAPQVVPVTGRKTRLRDAPPWDRVRLEHHTRGITWYDEDGHATTVRFAACAGVVAWRDGSRLLYGLDGSRLLLDTQVWRRAARITEHIDRHVPAPTVTLARDLDREPDQRRNIRRWIVRRVLRRIRSALLLLALLVASLAGVVVLAAVGGLLGVLVGVAVAPMVYDRWRRSD